MRVTSSGNRVGELLEVLCKRGKIVKDQNYDALLNVLEVEFREGVKKRIEESTPPSFSQVIPTATRPSSKCLRNLLVAK